MLSNESHSSIGLQDAQYYPQNIFLLGQTDYAKVVNFWWQYNDYITWASFPKIVRVEE